MFISLPIICPKNEDLGKISFKELSISEAELVLAVAQLNIHTLADNQFLLDLYLGNALKAIRFGFGQGNGWRSKISIDDVEAKQQIAGAIGFSAGAMLMHTDLGVDWRNIFPVKPTDVVNPNKKQERPDLLCIGNNFKTLIECKGTTRKDKVSEMVLDAIGQVKNTGMKGHTITDAYASCAFIPLKHTATDPFLMACDPPVKGNDFSSIIYEDIDTLRQDQYVRMCRYSGLNILADMILSEEEHPGTISSVRREIYNLNVINIDNVTFLARVIDVPQKMRNNEYFHNTRLVLGIQRDIVSQLLDYQKGFSLETINRDYISPDQKEAFLSTGICLRMVKEEDLPIKERHRWLSRNRAKETPAQIWNNNSCNSRSFGGQVQQEDESNTRERMRF